MENVQKWAFIKSFLKTLYDMFFCVPEIHLSIPMPNLTLTPPLMCPLYIFIMIFCSENEPFIMHIISTLPPTSVKSESPMHSVIWAG